MRIKGIRFFLKKYLLFCLVVTGMSLLLYDTVLHGYYMKIYPVMFGLIAGVTLLSQLKMMSSVHDSIRKFSTSFMSAMGIRMLVYLAFIIIRLVLDKSDAINFVVTFLVLYVCFTAFEVIEISDFLKNNPKSSN